MGRHSYVVTKEKNWTPPSYRWWALDKTHTKKIFQGFWSIFRKLSLNQEAQDLADTHNFQLVGYQFAAEKEDTRAPRIVRVGLVQNEIVVKDTSENVVVQREALYQRMAEIIKAAALAQVNVLCFQEAWSKWCHLPF